MVPPRAPSFFGGTCGSPFPPSLGRGPAEPGPVRKAYVARMIEQRFGSSPPLSLGIEEEIMILDGGSLMPVPLVRALTGAAEGMELPGLLKTELHASVVELNTGICGDADEAAAAIAELRRAAGSIAQDHGLRVAAAGSHPRARPEELEIVPEPRYLKFVEYAGISARRQGVSGLHVHVGMPSPDVALHVLDGIVPWLPLVLALSANSPYLAGEEAGLMSARAEILGLLPRHGAPPELDSYDDWERLVERLVATGLVSDYTALWWDARLHPRFGTIEIRAADQPTAFALTIAFVALLQALCASVREEPRRMRDAEARVVYDQNRWAASRYGPRAELIHPEGGHRVAVPELTAELLERVRP